MFSLALQRAIAPECGMGVRMHINWTSAELGHNLIKSENRKVLHMYPVKNVQIDIPAVSKDKVRIIAKKQQVTLRWD